MTTPDLVTIPARRGKAAFVTAGQHVRVVNTHGQQVVDTWAPPGRPGRVHVNGALQDGYWPDYARPGTVHGHQPTPADPDPGGRYLRGHPRYPPGRLRPLRYELLGCAEYHDNCTDNLAAALAELGLTPPETPSPWNLFMNIPVAADGSLGFEPPVCSPGDYVVLRAEVDCVVAFSACPQDMVPINGADCIPTEAHFQVI